MDQFSAHATSLESPASGAKTLIPSDSMDLSHVTRAIYVGSGGDLTVTMKEGGNATFKNMVGGTVIAIRVVRVLAAGTTATDIVGMY